MCMHTLTVNLKLAQTLATCVQRRRSVCATYAFTYKCVCIFVHMFMYTLHSSPGSKSMEKSQSLMRGVCPASRTLWYKICDTV